MDVFLSDISKNEFPLNERVSGNTIRNTLLTFIQTLYPNFRSSSYLSISELNFFREKFISDFLLKEIGELSELETTVLNSLKDQTILTDKLDTDDKQAFTLGQRIADKVASFGGSWTFIIAFGTFIALWIMLNIIWLQNKGFDPYPFILLNLLARPSLR